jgi:hypothetical protein
MDRAQAMQGVETGELIEAVIAPAEDANGWVVLLSDRAGEHHLYTGHTGTEKVYHDLDHATETARDLGISAIRVEERF